MFREGVLAFSLLTGVNVVLSVSVLFVLLGGRHVPRSFIRRKREAACLLRLCVKSSTGFGFCHVFVRPRRCRAV